MKMFQILGRFSIATFLRSALSNSFGLPSLIEKVQFSIATFLRSALSNSFGLPSLIEKVRVSYTSYFEPAQNMFQTRHTPKRVTPQRRPFSSSLRMR